MDKKVIFAVAGSGKTRLIIERLNLIERFLIVTYTNNNVRTLRNGIVKKFGHFPENIKLYSYFVFIYSFCYGPFLSLRFKTKGINYEGNRFHWVGQSTHDYFFDSYGRIYANRIAKFLDAQDILSDVNLRLSKYFDNLFIDEVQDLAGHDFNLLKSISQANLNIIAVGDFFQHTFDTSRDGNVNANLHHNYEKYKNAFRSMGLEVDVESLVTSHRCSISICKFISDHIGVEVSSARKDDTKLCFVENQEWADEIFRNKNIVKLFYQEHSKYGCYSKNWGDCKGEDHYGDVCVVLNKTTLEKFGENKLRELNPMSKNKLYVACSRARGDLYLAPEVFYKKYKL